jgi:hypothetical protein
MKEALIHIAKLLKNLFLIVLAIALFSPIGVVAIIWKVYVSVFHENRKAREILDGTSQFFFAIAIALDQFGNVAFGGLFDDVLITKKEFPFGKPYETISEVLGWNQELDNLTLPGKVIVAILDFLDKEHCKVAMLSGLFSAKYKVDKYRLLKPQFEGI